MTEAAEKIEAPAVSEIQRRDPLEPYVIRVPDSVTAGLDRVVELMSARLGEPPEMCRRFVELAVLQRGIQSLTAEEGKR